MASNDSSTLGTSGTSNTPTPLQTNMEQVNAICSDLMVHLTQEGDFDLPVMVGRLLEILANPEIQEVYHLSAYGIDVTLSTDTNFIKLIVELIQFAKINISHEVELVEAVRTPSGQVAEIESYRTIASVLATCLKQSCHQITVPCKSLDKGDADADAGAGADQNKCRNGIPLLEDGESHHCGCTFHLEPLATHLVLAGIFSALRARLNSMAEREIQFSFVLGLLHDIAKPFTLRTYEFKDKKSSGGRIFPAYPFHGEMGCRILRALYHPDMDFTPLEWYGLTEVVNRHMCGYHGANEGTNLLKRKLLRGIQIQSGFVGFDLIPFLSNLSFADGTAKFADVEQITDPGEFLADRAAFLAEMEGAFDLVDYLSSVGYNTEKLVVMPIGRSGAGKSHFIRMLDTRLESDTIICSRDQVIAFCTVNIDQRLEGDAYPLMYRIYEISKQVYAKKNKKDNKRQLALRLDLIEAYEAWNVHGATAFGEDFEILETPEPQADGEADEEYHARIAQMRVPNLSQNIRDEYNRRIEAALASRAKVVVIDTFMTSFPKGVKFGLTKKLAKYFKIHVHIDAFVSVTGSNGYDQNGQLQIGGPFQLESPFHPDAQKDIKEFQHETADMTCDPAKLSSRPGSVLNVTRTPNREFGYEQATGFITELVSRLEEPKVVPEAADAADAGVDLDLRFSHLNLREYVQMLVDSGADINEHFGIIGFKVSNPLFQKPESLGSLPTSERLRYYGALARLTELFVENGVMERAYTIRELMDDPELAASISKSLMLVKYIDALYGPRFWKNKWARQARGTVLFVHPITKVVSVLSYKLQRGAEVVTGQQKKSGVEETENWSGDNSIFDAEQVATIEALLDEKPIETFATSKGDGSLCIFSVFAGAAKIVMGCIIEAFGSDLAKLMRDQSAAASDDKYLVTMSTQGTIFESFYRISHMSPYMVTSALTGTGQTGTGQTGTGLVEYPELRVFAQNHTCYQAWNKWGSAFIESLLSVPLFFDEQSECQTFMFEAICPNRTDPFSGHEHTELAISYPYSKFYFLGTSICSKFAYIPHMLYREHCIKSGADIPSTFCEPLWWHIKDAEGDSTVSEILAGFSAVARHQITKFDFLQRCPPSNIGFDHTDPVLVENTPLDIEGLVLMTPLFFAGDNDEFFAVLGIRPTGYSKAKTVEYYNCHKFRTKYVQYYLDLHQFEIARSRFPLVTKVSEFFGPGNLVGALTEIGIRVMALLDGSAVIDAEDVGAGAGAAAAADAGADVAPRPYRAKYIEAFPTKAQNGFDRRPIDVQYKMMINIAREFQIDLIPIFTDVFASILPPESADARSEMAGMLKSVVMTLSPWEDGFDERIAEIDVESQAMKCLAMLVLGFKL
jgi:hypothetical protein